MSNSKRSNKKIHIIYLSIILLILISFFSSVQSREKYLISKNDDLVSKLNDGLIANKECSIKLNQSLSIIKGQEILMDIQKSRKEYTDKLNEYTIREYELALNKCVSDYNELAKETGKTDLITTSLKLLMLFI